MVSGPKLTGESARVLLTHHQGEMIGSSESSAGDCSGQDPVRQAAQGYACNGRPALRHPTIPSLRL